jgi:hypothetical protein
MFTFSSISHSKCLALQSYHSFFLFSVHWVELQGSGELFAMKAMDKSVMLNRNKVNFID